jgi:hypothetical protein
MHKIDDYEFIVEDLSTPDKVFDLNKVANVDLCEYTLFHVYKYSNVFIEYSTLLIVRVRILFKHYI